MDEINSNAQLSFQLSSTWIPEDTIRFAARRRRRRTWLGRDSRVWGNPGIYWRDCGSRGHLFAPALSELAPDCGGEWIPVEDLSVSGSVVQLDEEVWEEGRFFEIGFFPFYASPQTEPQGRFAFV